MREIRDKLCELAAAYDEQLQLYNRIEEVGSGEQKLIRDGHLDLLLQVLKEKEELLKQAGEYEQRIGSLQEQLVEHFALAHFSLPQLKLAAPSYYQEEIAAIEKAVSSLVPVLEGLEEQERRNEQSLSQYLETRQGTRTKKAQIRLAERAYGKKDL
ncbi:MAG: hypothetical protein GX251_03670 [Firmicutes bacterium]|nr:hypothetical protein [Bacillota bacterium]